MNDYPHLAELLDAIAHDWAVCDDSDDHDHMTLVNEDRDVHPTLKPPKDLFPRLEVDGLIVFNAELSHPKDAERQYMEFLDERIPEPFVYFYALTEAGRQHLKR